MNDNKYQEILENYDINVLNIKKVRGAYLCKSDEGLFELKEYSGTKQKMELLEELLQKLDGSDVIKTDCPVRNRDNELITENFDGVKYILKKWYEGYECDVKSAADVFEGIRTLARLHLLAAGCAGCADKMRVENPLEIYEKHNRELKRIKKYIREKNQKSPFELEVLKNYNRYYEMAERTLERLSGLCKNTGDFGIIHGNYNYHNIIFTPDYSVVTNFESSRLSIRMTDVCNYIRKVMEKYEWNPKIGIGLVECYDEIKKINDDERMILAEMLSYPEKFWKVLNHYYNGNKAFVPDKNLEKIKRIYGQEEVKSSFILKLSAL